jgi:hypothetical protein
VDPNVEPRPDEADPAVERGPEPLVVEVPRLPRDASVEWHVIAGTTHAGRIVSKTGKANHF